MPNLVKQCKSLLKYEYANFQILDINYIKS